MNKYYKVILPISVVAMLLSGCGQVSQSADSQQKLQNSTSVQQSNKNSSDVSIEEVSLEQEAVALTANPALSTQITPVASGTLVEKNDRAEIDYSNTSDGYVMVRFTGQTATRLKVQVQGPSTTYTYDLPQGSDWTTFSLSDGNGNYKVTVFENTTGTKYATVLSKSMSVSLKDEFAPFLCSNQYVNFAVAPKTVAKAQELIGTISDPLEKVSKVYDYVVKNITYDKKLADSVQSGYLPVLDTVLEKKSGICFDYAALMTGMLRSQNVPCKLVVGYAGTAYHAWISVWTPDSGWIDGAIYFDGSTWQRMDPTFASSGNQSESIMKYIGDGSNYTVKYLY